MATVQDEIEAEVHRQFNVLRGRLCGFIEACGLPDRQERGAIATLKTLSYDSEEKLVNLINE